MRKTSIVVISIALCMMFLFVPLTMADATTESFIIYTNKDTYLTGEAVNIYVKAEAIDPNQTITIHDVIVYDPNNISIAEWYDLEIVLEDTNTVKYVGTVIATSEGEYSVSAKATGCPWFLWSFWRFFCRSQWKPNVVPEFPFGTIAAVAAFLGATGLYIVKKKKVICER
ncbi:MAG: hypothetical protein NWF06_05460 [Candidatus Bathyarchaeota archaeon]|nr:hypothetical protein [Candidatus Bathyarchaeum sp.]